MLAQPNNKRPNVGSSYQILPGARRYGFLRAARAAMVFCAPLAALLISAGCATPFGAVDGPPSWCTAPAKTFPPVKEGEDLVQAHADMMQEWHREQSRRRCLTRYAKAISG